jgi:hypothetical protein
MKWRKVQDHVIAWVRTGIIEGRSIDLMNAMLIDMLATDFEVRKQAGGQHWKMIQLYADKAEQIIRDWDIRMVGRLREIFPHALPVTLHKGKLVCGYDEDGDWEVFVERNPVL